MAGDAATLTPRAPTYNVLMLLLLFAPKHAPTRLIV